jgi:hypothetical protein
LKAEGSSAFALVLIGSDASQMVASLVQTAGVGPLRVNTAIANWPQADAAFYEPLGIANFGRTVAMAFHLGTNLILLDSDAKEWETLQSVPADKRVIDVWWQESQTGELMLLLAYLMTRNKDWRDAIIRMIAVADDKQSPQECRQALEASLERMRIPGEVLVVDDWDELTVVETSKTSAMVFMPFRIHGGRFYSRFGWEIGPALPKLPITALVLAAQDVDLEGDPDQETEEEGATTTTPTP